MSMLQDLIQQIENPTLRDRISGEVDRLTKSKKFGLVFEKHLPECTPLFDMPIKVGTTVALKTGYVNVIYTVLSVDGDDVLCDCRETHEKETLQLDDIVAVAEFGEPIYPYLKPVDSVCNAPDSDLWHTLIEADNYHALQLLEYLYAGKVDCIYIDPPYNTGAKDWKYNNDFVDSSDAYRHSKWLSMMEKRLKLAKRLLNPEDSALIVTIDEKEYLHLGCLLEEMFPEARIQMVTTVIKPEGTQRRNEFSRTNEFIFFVMFGNRYVLPYQSDMVNDKSSEKTRDDALAYKNFRRTDSTSTRSARPNQFYPIFVDENTGEIVGVGDVMAPDERRDDIVPPPGQVAVFPLRDSGEEMLWRRTPAAFKQTLKDGYAYAEKTKTGFHIKYLSSQLIQQIEDGDIEITGRNSNGKLTGKYTADKLTMPKTVWTLKSHIARDQGSLPLKKIFAGEIRFTFPKSIYSVRDAIQLMLINKPSALIVDFFAGSGTTLHAVNLLNAEDGGHRRCILVTNNEVADDEAKTLNKQGYKPGNEEWEKYGIARYVTWPRTVCSIEGHDVNGKPLKGDYLDSDIPMADGFKTNAVYFKLGFLDRTTVALGQQFSELLPLLWLKAGAVNKCPELEADVLPQLLVLPENHFAVLLDEKVYMDFAHELESQPDVQTAYIVTDSEPAYRTMISSLDVKDTYQLYRDYLDNFKINMRSNA